MKSQKEFWDKTAPKYASSPVRDQVSYQKKLAITQEYLQPDWSVFEFGCGTGTTAIAHAPYVESLLATDISTEMLAIAERKARDATIRNIRFQVGTLDSLNLGEECFDAVLGLNILHLLDNVEVAVSQVYELLKPGGVFISSTALLGETKFYWRLLIPLAQSLGLAPYVCRFNREELLSMVTRAGFDTEYDWQPERGSIFIVARKPGE